MPGKQMLSTASEPVCGREARDGPGGEQPGTDPAPTPQRGSLRPTSFPSRFQQRRKPHDQAANRPLSLPIAARRRTAEKPLLAVPGCPPGVGTGASWKPAREQ